MNTNLNSCDLSVTVGSLACYSMLMTVTRQALAGLGSTLSKLLVCYDLIILCTRVLCLHEGAVCLLLVDLVTDIVSVHREVVLGMEEDDVTHVRDDHTLVHSFLQICQESETIHILWVTHTRSS